MMSSAVEVVVIIIMINVCSKNVKLFTGSCIIVSSVHGWVWLHHWSCEVIVQYYWGGGGGLVVSCLSWIVSAHLLYEYFNGSGQSKVARHDVIWQLSDLRDIILEYIW